ncbi:uncharacterized protein PV09_04539 [Verruconis gallopava]|uniref:Arf-GAP domain-containing protein n=1 Tax=Verruconis gallopava TaxID=253628 RepID=A0A0D2ABN2_9PEZI|nr:uncharacterized protein PV09_04539 [Verruconis gallopava]KIW04233.1 hypothetical protein PV09_04539 [Verruconis gallopava]
MSRRAVPESTAERNRNTLKQLVKLEANKSCCDCKRNKHPRWASWNLGIFICIRCSGIHRGMGTHISRVKSVDLDSWTDEQLQSMLKWGNARANKYWEAKLAPGHIPAEAKIENFIRTKYESKRWVMDGGMPDPSTLDVEGDDDVPLSVVQEKAKIERSTSQRVASSSGSAAAITAAPQAVRQTQNVDLFGDEPPARPSTGPPASAAAPPKRTPKPTQPGDSLLGLDFLSGPTAAPPARPSSNPSLAGNATSRPDLKQSILSLYASKPAAPPQQPQHAPSNSGSFGAPSPPGQSGLGGINDAFASLSFSQPTQQSQKPSPFAGLDSGMKSPRSSVSKPATTSFGGGGSFFDTPASPPPPQAKPAHTNKQPSFGGFDDFISSPAPANNGNPPAKSNDLFDLMSGDSGFTTSQATTSTSQATATTPSYNNSAFNLSSPAPAAQSTPVPTTAKSPTINLASNFDAWGSSNAWNDDKPTTSVTTTNASASGDFGWGSSASTSFGQSKATPQVSADEDFGDWGHASPVATTTTSTQSLSKPSGGFSANTDDLFSNVWQ